MPEESSNMIKRMLPLKFVTAVNVWIVRNYETGGKEFLITLPIFEKPFAIVVGPLPKLKPEITIYQLYAIM